MGSAITPSLSARRAWIEMPKKVAVVVPSGVALRKESVDRNTNFVLDVCVFCVALRKESVDRNIMYLLTASGFFIVALRKESVDRNCDLEPIKNPEAGRSPQGERG